MIPCHDLEDLKKARWYLDREIAKREAKGRAEAENVSDL